MPGRFTHMFQAPAGTLHCVSTRVEPKDDPNGRRNATQRWPQSRQPTVGLAASQKAGRRVSEHRQEVPDSRRVSDDLETGTLSVGQLAIRSTS